MTRLASADDLCCCEYVNSKGEKAHILGCCCDCEAVDEAFDRCIGCNGCAFCGDKVMSTILDRLRIPWAGGAGAIQLQLDVFAPIIIIPSLLVLSITHRYAAWTLSLATPLALILYYRRWRRNPQRERTRFFFSWGLVSVFTMGYVFSGVAILYREVELYEGMTVTGAFFLMIYALYLTKQDPGSVRPTPHNENDLFSRTVTYSAKPKNPNTPSIAMQVKERLDQIKGRINEPWTPEGGDNSPATPSSMASTAPPTAPATAPPTAGHSRANSSLNGILINIPPKKVVCNTCNVKTPNRASHCNVCNQCYQVRDHHCIWLDQCIGERNHRSFFSVMLLFLFCAIYGLHLSLTVICTPIMVFDYFLVPYDCRFVYSTLWGAIAYVSCCYTVVSVILVLIVLVQQILLISQNITMQEYNNAVRENKLRRIFGLIISDNPYNINIKSNWLSFFHRNRERIPTPRPMQQS